MKIIIYNMNTGEIVRITEQTPDFRDLEDNEDFDSYNNWMSFEDSAKKVRQFELLNKL